MTSNSEDSSSMESLPRPRTAFILCQIGAVYNLGIGGYLLLTLQYPRYPVLFTNGGALGAISVIVGALVLISGGLLFLKPEQHVKWSAVVATLSVSYWVAASLVAGQDASAWSAFGSAYSLSGGILGLLWKTRIPL